MNIEKTRKIKDYIIIILASLIMAAFFSFVFYRQAIMHNGEYISDLPTIINMALTTRPASVLLAFIRLLLEKTGYMLYSVGLFEGLLMGFTWAYGCLFIHRHFGFKMPAARLLSFGLLFLTGIAVPVLFPRFFNGSIVTQPWQNISYIAMRAFALPAMYYFVDLFRIYSEEKRIAWKYWILTCVMTFLATLMKTGFIMVFATALTGFLLFDIIKKKTDIKTAVLMGALLIPSLILLFVQYYLLATQAEGEPYRIIFGLSGFFFSEGILFFIMKFISGLAFPAIVLWHNRRRLRRDTAAVIAGYDLALIEAMLFVEGGAREGAGSFLWGMMLYAYFLFLYTVPMLISDLTEKKQGNKNAGSERLYRIIGTILMLLHLGCGLYYYYWLMKGNYFYI